MLVAMVFGLDPAWGMFAVPFIGFLAGFGWACFGICIAGFASSIENFNYVISAVLTPLFLVAGTFFPIDQLPDWAQVLAQLNPLYHCVELVRHAAFGWEGLDGPRAPRGARRVRRGDVARGDPRDAAQARRLSIGRRPGPDRIGGVGYRRVRAARRRRPAPGGPRGAASRRLGRGPGGLRDGHRRGRRRPGGLGGPEPLGVVAGRRRGHLRGPRAGVPRLPPGRRRRSARPAWPRGWAAITSTSAATTPWPRRGYGERATSSPAASRARSTAWWR